LTFDAVILKLAEVMPEGNIIKNCDMSKATSFRAGGRALAMICPEDVTRLRKSLQILSRSGIPYAVMGNGTNILITDGGYQGVIVKIGEAFSEINIIGQELTCGAGTLISAAAKAAMEAGLSGFEFASGIPGSMGGAVFMNAGAYGNEMKNIVKCVNIMSRDGEREYVLFNEELAFSYRRSILYSSEDIVTGITIKLEKGRKDAIKEKMLEINALRNEKQPVSTPSAGSFFKRPPGHFAGKLIEEAGLKGLSVGGAAVSDLHAGFIVNNNNATATDIIDLMNIVQLTVHDKFGINLEPEVRIIGD